MRKNGDYPLGTPDYAKKGDISQVQDDVKKAWSKESNSVSISKRDVFNIGSILVWVLAVCFFLASVKSNVNPVDMFFGDGAGNGGLLNMFADFGNDFLDFMYGSTELFKSWGLVNSGNGWLDVLGQILSISTFVINIFIQLVVLIFKLLIFVLSGGAVAL